MGTSAPALRLIQGGDQHPLRSGWCRRSGCAEPAVDLGFCNGCLGLYHRTRVAWEAELAQRAAATRRKLESSAGPEAQAEWSLVLSEHLAAAGVDPDDLNDETAVYEAMLSALADFTRSTDAEHAGMRVVR
jgi:hypothetical protein